MKPLRNRCRRVRLTQGPNDESCHLFSADRLIGAVIIASAAHRHPACRQLADLRIEQMTQWHVPEHGPLKSGKGLARSDYVPAARHGAVVTVDGVGNRPRAGGHTYRRGDGNEWIAGGRRPRAANRQVDHGLPIPPLAAKRASALLNVASQAIGATTIVVVSGTSAGPGSQRSQPYPSLHKRIRT